MKHLAPLLFLLSLGALVPRSLRAQCDEVADNCSTELFPFNSDGQYYRAELIGGESAKLKITFYEGIVYRIIPCSGVKGEQLIFSLYDKKGNLLYTNENAHGTTGYWDFQFGATSDYTLVAHFKKGSGCAAFLVGYQEENKQDELDAATDAAN